MTQHADHWSLPGLNLFFKIEVRGQGLEPTPINCKPIRLTTVVERGIYWWYVPPSGIPRQLGSVASLDTNCGRPVRIRLSFWMPSLPRWSCSPSSRPRRQGSMPTCVCTGLRFGFPSVVLGASQANHCMPGLCADDSFVLCSWMEVQLTRLPTSPSNHSRPPKRSKEKGATSAERFQVL